MGLRPHQFDFLFFGLLLWKNGASEQFENLNIFSFWKFFEAKTCHLLCLNCSKDVDENWYKISTQTTHTIVPPDKAPATYQRSTV